MNIEKYQKHLLDRDYMSGADRDRTRVKQSGEVFTPDALVSEILDQLDPEFRAKILSQLQQKYPENIKLMDDCDWNTFEWKSNE